MTTAKSHILFVDDEVNILNSLQRVFREAEGYTLHFAVSMSEARKIMEKQLMDVVVVDLFLPDGHGTDLLEEISSQHPDTGLVMLTGNGEAHNIKDAINRGHVDRYITKPWDEIDLKMAVAQAAETRALKLERDALLLKLQDQNDKLEVKVHERTQQIRQAADLLQMANARIKKTLSGSIATMAQLADLAEADKNYRGHGRRVADLAVATALAIGLSEGEVERIRMASLLHDLGKSTLPEHIRSRPYAAMTPAEKKMFHEHPAIGAGLLLGFDDMTDVAAMIASHHERIDGKGYPGHLKGDKIPIGARIISIVADYDDLRFGRIEPSALDVSNAVAHLQSHAGTHYDRKILEAFELMLNADMQLQHTVKVVPMTGLQPGMILAKDVLSPSGLMILCRGTILTEPMLTRLANFSEHVGQVGGSYYIYTSSLTSSRKVQAERAAI